MFNGFEDLFRVTLVFGEINRIPNLNKRIIEHKNRFPAATIIETRSRADEGWNR